MQSDTSAPASTAPDTAVAASAAVASANSSRPNSALLRQSAHVTVSESSETMTKRGSGHTFILHRESSTTRQEVTIPVVAEGATPSVTIPDATPVDAVSPLASPSVLSPIPIDPSSPSSSSAAAASAASADTAIPSPRVYRLTKRASSTLPIAAMTEAQSPANAAPVPTAATDAPQPNSLAAAAPAADVQPAPIAVPETPSNATTTAAVDPTPAAAAVPVASSTLAAPASTTPAITATPVKMKFTIQKKPAANLAAATPAAGAPTTPAATTPAATPTPVPETAAPAPAPAAFISAPTVPAAVVAENAAAPSPAASTSQAPPVEEPVAVAEVATAQLEPQQLESNDYSNVPDHPAAASLQRLSTHELGELIKKATPTNSRPTTSGLGVNFPPPAGAMSPAKENINDAAVFTAAISPTTEASPSITSPSQTFSTPAKPDKPQAAEETEVKPFTPIAATLNASPSQHTPAATPSAVAVISPASATSASRAEPRSSTPVATHTGSILDEHLPTLTPNNAPHSRRNSWIRNGDLAPLLPADPTSSSTSPPATTGSKSRRNSLSALPPINNHISPTQQSATVTPAAASTTPNYNQGMDEMKYSDDPAATGSKRTRSPAARSSDAAVNTAVMELIETHGKHMQHAHHSAHSSGPLPQIPGLSQPSQQQQQERPPLGRPVSVHAEFAPTGVVPSTAERKAHVQPQVKGVASVRNNASRSKPAPPVSFVAVENGASERILPTNRWNWILPLLFCTLILIASFVIIFAFGGGYDKLNPTHDGVVLIGLVLHIVGVFFFLVTMVLILLWGTPFKSIVGIILQLGVSASMLGTASFIQSESLATMEVIWNDLYVGAYQLQLVAVFFLGILFAVWLYHAPERQTASVLLLLDAIDMSSLSRDIRTMKGINAELIQQQINRNNGGVAPNIPAWEDDAGGRMKAPLSSRENNNATYYFNSTNAASNSRPTTAQVGDSSGLSVRPTTASGLPIPDYALGTYEGSGTPNVVNPGTGSYKSKREERRRTAKRSSLGGSNAQQFLSVSALGTLQNGSNGGTGQVVREAPPGVAPATPINYALPANTRRTSMEGQAMKQLMAQNIELASRVREMEMAQQTGMAVPPPMSASGQRSNATPPVTARVGDMPDMQQGPTFRS